MSRFRIVVGVGFIVVGIALAPWGRAAEPETSKPAAPAETERERALKQQLVDRAEEINKLKLENARLKREIRELKSRQPAVLPQLPPLNLAPQAPNMPKNAIPREFNGETYYLVPLNGTAEPKSGTQGHGAFQLHGENQSWSPASNLPTKKTGR